MDSVVKKISYLLIIFLVLLVPLNYINRVNSYYIDIRFHEVLWYLIPVFIVIYIYNIFRKNIKLGICDYLIYILTVLNIIVCVFAVDRDISIYGNDVRNEGFLSFLAYYLVFLNCRCLSDRKDIKKILGLFCFVGIFQFIYCIFQIFFKDLLISQMIYYVSSNMASGFINNPNFMGSYVVLLLGFVVMKYLTNDKGYIWYFILSLIFYVHVLFSQSTGPFLGVVCMVLFALIFLVIKRKLKVLRYLVLLVAFVLSYFGIDYSLNVVPSANQFVVESYTLNYDLKQLYRAITGQMEIYDMPENDPNFDYYAEKPVANVDNLNGLGSGRIMIWRNSLKLIPDYYLFGCGIDNFGLVYKWHYEGVYYDKAHNDFLQVLITRGIFSLIAYLVFLVMLVIKGIKSKDNLVWGLLLSVVGYAAQSFTNISVVNVAPYFYMICGLLIAMVSTEKVK